MLPAVALLAACAKTPPTYFPLNAGWEWEYAAHTVTSDGPRDARYLVANLPSFEYEGVTTFPRRSPSGNTILYTVGDSGLQRVAEQGAQTGIVAYPTPLQVLPAHPAIGMHWRSETRTLVLEVTSHAAGALYRIDVDVPLNYTVAAVNESVSVPAGNFDDCLRIEAAGTTQAQVRKQVGLAEVRVEITEWYCAGAGLVRSVRRESTSSTALKPGSLELNLLALRHKN